MQHYICIHGHFYQPPRENPWLEAIELEDSARPYHDWNERITAECYEQNTVARILDDDGHIRHIINNYSRMSFNVGPTLLSWMEQFAPDVYAKILDADRESIERFAGHGSAIAQVYNHIIMPLATQRDKITQVLWGIHDFTHRFGRAPEGMWLAETAVDIETLETLAANNIRFTILSPYQAQRVRPFDSTTQTAHNEWHDVSGGHIDTTMPYLQRLPSGRSIALYFYNAPIAQAVAFEQLLSSGQRFAERLLTGVDKQRDHPQLVHIATDGESYGHHHMHGEMALAYALHTIETNKLARITNYGEFLDLHPPEYEVHILENTAWSCVHGVGRWHLDCGCRAANTPGWNQSWRAPLRSTFDWLRDTLAPLFEQHAAEFVYDPWQARNDYITVIINRSHDNVAAFLARHATRTLTVEENITVIHLFEMQRQLLLMYTSCGWFFDELSGIEAMQVMKYAGRALHLARILFNNPTHEETFLQQLEQAKSNLPDKRNGRYIFETWIRPSEVDLTRVVAHYAVTSLFEKHPSPHDTHNIYCYRIHNEDYHRFEPGMAKVIIGKVRATSTITHETHILSFGVLYFGEHNLNAGVNVHTDDTKYTTLVHDVTEAMNHGNIAEGIRLLDTYFTNLEYSVQTLFRDEQRKFLDDMLESTITDDEAIYRQIYERRTPLMHLLTSFHVPLPRTLHATAEFIVNSDLRHAVLNVVPEPDQVAAILERANMWEISLDHDIFSYMLQQKVEQLVADVRAHPNDLHQIQRLDKMVDVIRTMPFEVDFWKIQNTYYSMIKTVYVEMQERADEGEDEALLWTHCFVALGEKLGVRVTEMQHSHTAPTVTSVMHDVLTHVHIPRATYRLQFNPLFTFEHAMHIVPYLNELGISDCYASPIFRARAGSSHGYDVCNHSEINPVLGGDDGLQQLSAALRHHNMSMVLDIVPNHMGIGDVCNEWWMDVLENGQSSDYAIYFDIEWQPVKPELAGKVLLPILGDQYGRVLENGELRVNYEDGAFYISYYEHRFPVAPGTYSHILSYELVALSDTFGTNDDPDYDQTHEHEHLQEYRSIITAISYLPPRTELDPAKRVERNREKEVIKRRIASLYQESTEVRAAIDHAVQMFNGTVGAPHSFDLLDRLINEQSYRLAFWRVAAEEINYRRFFDINDLAAIRTEEEIVFHDTHQLIFRLLSEGTISGLRVDHIDGLYNPAAYFEQLQEGFMFHQVQSRLRSVRTDMPDDDTLTKRIHTRLGAYFATLRGERDTTPERATPYPLYVVAEKILSEHETLPHNWWVHGTTGYDFLATTNGVFVQSANSTQYDTLYQQFTGMTTNFQRLVNANKKMIMLVSMDSEIYALSHQLERIAERNRRYRDFTLNTLTFALREIIACLSVYRTYIITPDYVMPRDRQYIEAAVNEAIRNNPRTAVAVFEFIRDTLLLRNTHDFQLDDEQHVLQWVRKFQQVTGPVMAKGVEDTTFYAYNRLVSLNEVGGHPEYFGSSVAVFHERNSDNQQLWPHTMLASSTHDTKRSEDVRARINVLSEMPEQWQAAVERWRTLNAACKTMEPGKDGQFVPAPDNNDEYLLYQTLVGAWLYDNKNATTTDVTNNSVLVQPTDNIWHNFCERIVAYMQKATKEAKVHTSWVQPNDAYDTAVREFIYRILDATRKNEFLADIRAFTQHIAFFGKLNSLSQTTLKLTAPGVPDMYQGTELWDLSLVDPDNRRAVDYEQRQTALASLKERIAQHKNNLVPLTDALLAYTDNGHVKLYTIYQLLQLRRAHTDLFTNGSYTPLDVHGEQRDHICAFSRHVSDDNGNTMHLLVVVPRLMHQLTAGTQTPPCGNEVWGTTQLIVPDVISQGLNPLPLHYRNLFTGELLTVAIAENTPISIAVADALRSFPVAVLVQQPS